MQTSTRKRSRKSPEERLDELIDNIVENSKDPSWESEAEPDGDDLLASLPEDVFEDPRTAAFYFLPWPDAEYCAYARLLTFDPVQIEVLAIVYSVRKPEGEVLSLQWPPGERISFLQFEAAEEAGWAPLEDSYLEITYHDGFREWAHTRCPADCENPKDAIIYSEFSPDGVRGALRSHVIIEIREISKDEFEDQVEALWGLL